MVILLIVVFVITGCSSGTTTTTPTTPTTTAPAATTPGATTPAATTPAATKPSSTTPAASTPASSSPAATSTVAGNIIRGGTLKWVSNATPGTPIGWNPETSGGSVFTMQLSLQYLLKEQIDGSLTPNLAESYEVNTDPNNASITFHLRKGVKFSDGSDFNAQAVKWNYEQTKAGGMNNASTQFWKSFDVLDDYTIRINMTTWQNRLARSFADGVAFTCSPTAFQKNGIDWIRWHMVGTGPFVQTDFQRDVSLTTTKNTNYWEQGKPYLDGVQLLYVTDSLTAQALFKSGGADVINSYSNLMASQMQAEGYNVISQLGGATVLAPDSMNADSPWSNIKVRQAAEYAIDKVSMTKTFGYGFTQPAYQLNSSKSPAYDANLTSRAYDVAKAKQLLTEAGYPNGFKTTIINTTPGLGRDECTAIQAYFRAVGIQADLQFPEAAQATAYLTGTWKNAVLYNPLIQWANPNTGFNFYFGVPKSTWFPSTARPANWADIVTPSLIASKVDAALAQKAEGALYNDDTVIPLFFSVANIITTNKVRDSLIGTRGASTWWEPQQTWLSK